MTDQPQDHGKTYDDWRSDFINQLWIVFEKATRDAGLHLSAYLLTGLAEDMSGNIVRSAEEKGWDLTTETTFETRKKTDDIVGVPSMATSCNFYMDFPNLDGPGKYTFKAMGLWIEEENHLVIISMTLTYLSPAA